MTEPLLRSEKISRVMTATAKLKEKLEAKAYEGNLIDFVDYMWPVVEPAIPFVKGWPLSAIADHLQAVTRGQIRRLLINVPPGFSKSLLTDVFWPAWEWGPQNRPWYRYVCAAYSNHLTERDNMRCRNVVMSDRYQRLWGNKFRISNEQFTKVKFANDKTGWKLATSTGGIGVGERGDRFIIDDPNNTMMMESEAVRYTTNMWFTEVVPDRLNNPKESAIVIIQQRLHEEDVSGVALDRDLGYTHLCVPMEYVPHPFVNGYDVNNKIKTFDMSDPDNAKDMTGAFWQDPRTEDGEPAWPVRFGPEQIEELKRAKGPYAWCNAAEAPILMGDMSLKRIDKVREGDEIVGFTIGNMQKRAKLKKAKVLSISVSEQPIVRMTLSSGEVIRCTANHKWWTARNDKSHRPYAPAKLGTTLSRVCPVRLPELDNLEDQRLAGWLAGFFDGEGSVSLNHRRGDEANALITFTQGDGRNGPLCDKLEHILDHFGFNWGVKVRPTEHGHNMRHYWLKMAKEGRASRLPLYQKFLHVVQPTKWRDRIIESTTSGRLYTSGERVISIEPDGIETVYGLETTTGNYVVWGLASSNSGQYQQTPEIRGGSIIRREYWNDWEDAKYPDFEYILASIDTAYTEKQENDASAMTLWGLFRDASNNPKIMLMHAWQDRLQINDLVQRTIDYCTQDYRTINYQGNPFDHPRWPIDRLLIEAKATGLSVSQEIRRVIGFNGSFGVELINPTKQGDKVARAHSVLHLFSDGMIYAPTSRGWAQEVIDQCAKFPKGSHDDFVDSTTQALRYFRDHGFALLRSENEYDMEQELAYRPKLSALYPV